MSDVTFDELLKLLPAMKANVKAPTQEEVEAAKEDLRQKLWRSDVPIVRHCLMLNSCGDADFEHALLLLAVSLAEQNAALMNSLVDAEMRAVPRPIQIS